jgi:hypothetical protein
VQKNESEKINEIENYLKFIKGISRKTQLFRADTRFYAQLQLSATPAFPRAHQGFFCTPHAKFCLQETCGFDAT